MAAETQSLSTMEFLITQIEDVDDSPSLLHRFTCAGHGNLTVNLMVSADCRT